jgi:hypothetical protein
MHIHRHARRLIDHHQPNMSRPNHILLADNAHDPGIPDPALEPTTLAALTDRRFLSLTP